MSKDVCENRKEERSDRTQGATRMEESRDLEKFERAKRNIVNMNFHSALDVPESYKPQGMVYRWGRQSCLGKPDDLRMMQLEHVGWTPVPASRHPDLLTDSILGKTEDLPGYIYKSGSVLMERRKELDVLEDEQLKALNHEKLISTPALNNALEPGMPIYDSSQTYISKAIKNPTFGGR